MRRVVLAAVVLGAIQVALALRWPWLWWYYAAAVVSGRLLASRNRRRARALGGAAVG